MHWEALDAKFRSFLGEDHDRPLYILAPFITTSYLEDLFSQQREVHIVTSWRKDHLITGVSSIDLYDVVKRNNSWKLYINDRLHAKVYCRNFESLIVGSANLSKKALMDTERSNHEVLVQLDCTRHDARQICEIMASSVVMNDEIYSKYETWFSEQEIHSEPMETGSVVEFESSNDLFLVSQLPASTSPSRLWEIVSGQVLPDQSWDEMVAAEHDLSNLGLRFTDFDNYSDFEERLIDLMPNQAFFSAFIDEITIEGMRFGYAKQWVQENCIDDPVPYRKKLTRTVQNLFSWIIELFGDSYEIIRPNFSQVIRKRQTNSDEELCIFTGLQLNSSWYVSETNFPEMGIQYKTCPNCSVLKGELVFYIGRVYPITVDNIEKSDFGFTPQRHTRYNPDGIQTWCKCCRSNREQSQNAQRRYSISSLKRRLGENLAITKRAF